MEMISVKISSIKLLDGKDGLDKSDKLSLGNLVVIAGKNGSGKTRFLKRLQNYLFELKANKNDNGEMNIYIPVGDSEEVVTIENAGKIELVNYSHYDAQLQSAKKFSPYVISHARELLKEYNYRVTALNANLLLKDMSRGYSEEFKDGKEFDRFIKEYLKPLDIVLSKDENGDPQLFGRDTDDAALSPGQLYLIRMAVACYCNEQNENVVFILDEPELHLHPDAQIRLIKLIRDKHPNAQIWVSTHSLSLISFITVWDYSSTVLVISNGQVNKLRSDSTGLINSLLGTEENLFAVKQFLHTPEAYACNRFAIECMRSPEVFDSIEKGNPENDLIEIIFDKKSVIIDYGAGKCRLLEEMENIVGTDRIKSSLYYAYEPSPDHVLRAKEILASYGFAEDRYFSDMSRLHTVLDGKADYIIMVNVLHEIHPLDWEKTFSDIKKLLKKKDGVLIIVELSELTVGESPSGDGFLMITEEGANNLFGEGKYSFIRHPNPKKKHIVSYRIREENLDVNVSKVKECVDTINKVSFEKISKMKDDIQCEIDKRTSIPEYSKGKGMSDEKTYKDGLHYSFLLNQYVNSTFISQKL